MNTNTRNEVADLLARGCAEAKELADMCAKDPQAFAKVTDSCVASLIDACKFSTDVYLHKLIRFLSFAEGCSDSSIVVEQKAKYVAAFEKCQHTSNFLTAAHAALIASDELTIPSVLCSIMSKMQPESRDQTQLYLKDFVDTEIELLLREKASRQVEPNVQLVQSISSGVTSSTLWTLVLNVVSRLEQLMSGSTLSVFERMFEETYAEVWAIVAQRTQHECTADTCLWRTIIAWTTQDVNKDRAAFSLLMFFLYVEGMVSILRQMTQAPSRVKYSNTTSASSFVPIVPAAPAPPDCQINAVSVSVPAYDTGSIAQENTEPEKPIDASASRIIQINLNDTADADSPYSGTTNSASVENTLASLKKFVDMNTASFPDGLPSNLLKN